MNKCKDKNKLGYSGQFNELTKEESRTIKAGAATMEFVFSISECIRKIFD